MPLKPHPTDPDKMVYVNRYYDIPELQGVTMTPEDDEFNRIERESRARKMSVAYNLEMQRLRDEFPFGIPFVTQEELERLRKEHE